MVNHSPFVFDIESGDLSSLNVHPYNAKAAQHL